MSRSASEQYETLAWYSCVYIHTYSLSPPHHIISSTTPPNPDEPSKSKPKPGGISLLPILHTHLNTSSLPTIPLPIQLSRPTNRPICKSVRQYISMLAKGAVVMIMVMVMVIVLVRVPVLGMAMIRPQIYCALTANMLERCWKTCWLGGDLFLAPLPPAPTWLADGQM